MSEDNWQQSKEFFFCVSEALSHGTAQDYADLARWQKEDGTKRGLLRAFPQLQRLQRAGDISGDDFIALEEERRAAQGGAAS